MSSTFKIWNARLHSRIIGVLPPPEFVEISEPSKNGVLEASYKFWMENGASQTIHTTKEPYVDTGYTEAEKARWRKIEIQNEIKGWRKAYLDQCSPLQLFGYYIDSRFICGTLDAADVKLTSSTDDELPTFQIDILTPSGDIWPLDTPKGMFRPIFGNRKQDLEAHRKVVMRTLADLCSVMT